MNRTITISPRKLFLAGLLGLVSVATVGYANSNTVPGSSAGDGSGTISGYAVSNVHYTLDTNNPSTVTNLSFTINPALPSGTGTARISLNGGSTWLLSNACSGTTTVSCSIPSGTTVTSLATLRVVAAQ
ncbi:MAG: hypothetical protein U0837_08465 [Dehalococcoidia bacterium]|jgi:hypothetical protein